MGERIRNRISRAVNSMNSRAARMRRAFLRARGTSNPIESTFAAMRATSGAAGRRGSGSSGG